MARNAGAETIHHELRVKLQAAQSAIAVIDEIQLPEKARSVIFSLRSDFDVEAHEVELEMLGPTADGHEQRYRIKRLPPGGKVQLEYRGTVSSRGTKGIFDMPEAVLNAEGVYLDGASRWVPRFDGYPWLTFNMVVEAPAGWEVVSQGARRASGSGFHFAMPHPQDNVYLLGGPYQRYSIEQDGIEIVVYLYEDDAELAEKYLQTSAGYVSLYSQWVGPYPYAKFAVVENRWQTGYGMPSFTLLGSRVIRLPFILHTSLPHEILHNWWGNGVYVDAGRGNWSEGLTAYMSDHYSDEQRGTGGAYRRKALERYANYAAEDRDFALADFASRHDEASQAVGYSKSMMLFHMLRTQAGDELFNKNIQRLWQRYRFSVASFTDVIRQLHTGDDSEYQRFVEQWLDRAGAPEIIPGEMDLRKQGDTYILTLQILQQQAGPVYHLQLPLEVQLEGVSEPFRQRIALNQRTQTVVLEFEQRPASLRLDPDYDVFRLLHNLERPASLGRLFGAKKQLLIVPAAATEDQSQAWQQLAAAWSRRFNNVELVYDDAVRMPSADTAVWLLGWQNRLLPDYRQRFSSDSQQLASGAALLEGQQFSAGDHAVVLLDPDNSRSPLGFIGTDDPVTIAALARKLTHYSSYGALAFNEPEARNVFNKRLPVLRSPMARLVN